jgi:hypothetical protein
VDFTPVDGGAGGELRVYVEDGTFRPLAELRGE